MSIDMSQFYQVFFDETAEHLATMESLLLALDTTAPSLDDLNAIFRAAHSIKGSSGTFGFTDMTDVTHELETLLDRLRKQELAVTSAMVDAFLEARDVIKGQLDAHRGGPAADTALAVDICARLKTLASGEAPAAAAAPVPVVAAPVAAALEIEFTPASDTVSLKELLEGLAALGPVEILEQPPVGRNRKKGAKAQPWRVAVTTAASDVTIKELFDFVAAPEAVRISRRPDAAAVASAASATAADPGYGFFADAANAPAADPGYGFFNELPVAAPAAAAAPGSGQYPAHGRRATDSPDTVSGVAGRRDNDKVVTAPQGETSSIRVSVEKVDSLINLVGELVITQAMLAQSAAEVDPVLHEKLLNGMAQLERNTRDLQESVMSIRMMPISFVFSRFPRVVRDLAGKLGKQVELKTVGEGTELDKGLIEKIADPLTHLVRNSLDHGIETPEKRIAAGKPAKGTITLRAYHQGGNIIIEVGDDGAGLNRERILAKARERGMAVPDTLSDAEVWGLIFEAGFSTAEVVTDVSGRGVGMDVVKRNIHALGGRVEIDSAAGAGTRISVRLPLTLAILDGLSVAVGDEMFIVPLTYIVESLQPAAAEIKTVSGRGRVVHVRGEYLPLVALHEVFNIRPLVAEVHRGIIVILEAENRKVAMFVDALVGQHQVVIKSLESNFRRVNCVSGATIMGDGRVALILDAVAVTRESRQPLAEAA